MLTAVAIGVAAIAMAAAAGLAWVHFREQPPVTTPVRFEMPAPAEAPFSSTGVLSPDGRSVAFDAPGPDGRPILWVRSFDVLEARPLAGTEGVSPGPIWSPDSRFLAFGVNGFPGRLKKVAVSGGPPQTLCEYPAGRISRGRVEFGRRDPVWRGKRRCDARARVRWSGHAGHQNRRVPAGDPACRTGMAARRTPLPLPSRVARAREHRHLHRVDRGDPGQSKHHAPAGHRLGSGVCARVGRIGRRLHPVPAARLAAGAGVRWMRSFAETRFPYPRTSATLGSYGWFSASPSGAIAFRASATSGAKADLVWFDRQGHPSGTIRTKPGSRDQRPALGRRHARGDHQGRA